MRAADDEDTKDETAPWVRAARESREVVEAALRRRDLAPRARERLEMVKAVALGYALAEVARWSGRTERTVARWLGAFATGGVAAVADAPRAGRPARADAAYLAALEQAVDTPPPALGLPFDAWTSARLSAYLAEVTGVRIAPGWLRALLARRRCRTGRPKHTLGHRQDPAAETACEQTLQVVGEKGGGRHRAVRAALPG
jgi:transposase